MLRSRSKNLLVVSLLSISMAGCAKRAVVPVPGQLNTFDAYAYRVLADAQAALNDFKASVTSGKLSETPTLKTVLNQAITDYDSANTVYQAWHSAGGTGSTVQIAMALDKLNADITNVTASGGK